jgi:hypothetical protein
VTAPLIAIPSGREDLKAGVCIPIVFQRTRPAGDKEDIGNDGIR